MTYPVESPAPHGRGLRVLMIAFEFPPLASGGVYRAAKLAKFLSRLGVDLDVVTVRPEDYRAWSPAPLDDSLGSDLPPCVRVHRITSGFPAWYWKVFRSRLGARLAWYAHFGDPLSWFWRGPLRTRIESLVAERRPDVLFATVPPFGVAVLAREAAHRHRLPWVIDWRDPWTLWRFAPFPTWAHYRYARSREGACLREANRSLATSPVTRDDWFAEFSGVSPQRARVVYNGYDPEDLTKITPELPSAGRRRIVYVGSFYYEPEIRAAIMRPVWRRPPGQWLLYRKRREDWRYRSPYYFLLGLKVLAEREPDLVASLDVVFAGTIPSWLPAMLEETGTRRMVNLRGPVPHHESLALQAGADALLLTSAKIDDGRDYSIAGKVFEYLGLRRPVLGVVTDGAMRDMIVRAGTSIIADPDDTEAVAAAIAIVARGEAESRIRPDERFIEGLRREQGARTVLAELRAAADEGYRG